MKRLILTLAVVMIGALPSPVAADAAFGLHDLDLTFTNPDGSPATQAGSHPFAMTTTFGINYSEEGGHALPDGRLKDAILEQITGFVADTTAYPRCSTVDFMTHPQDAPNKCPLDTAVGVTASAITEPNGWHGSAVFNLTPPPGVLLRLGFHVEAVDLVVDAGLKHSSPYRPVAAARNIPETLYVFGSKFQLWGNPSDPEHDNLRGKCYFQTEELKPGEEFEFEDNEGTCPVTPRSKPLLTLPTRCSGPNVTSFAVDSFEHPGLQLDDGEPDLSDPAWLTGSVETHDGEGNFQPFTGCANLGFSPSISAKPTSRAAQSPTGLDFGLDVKDEGLTSVEGLAQSDIKKAVVTLPEGMTANPSVAEGLEVCSTADLARETVDSAPGEGCPEASKIGTIEVESPLTTEPIKGALYQATPYENEFNSLLAFYFVIKNPQLGVIVKQAAKVEPDPVSGQLVAITDDIPQLPFSHFRLHFREGGRSPLISPPGCGEFPVKAQLTPWSGGPAVEASSVFQIVAGPDEAPCPAGGVAPFHPGFEAGTIDAAAGAYSPFYMRLTRRDGEQNMTKFSAILPPGVLANLAGVAKCSDAAIAAAKARIGPHGGHEELANPSCPSASRIGRTLAGAGVGSQLTYVPGSLYLAGPIAGDPLSVVAITPAVAGPFDAGTVVVREALTVNPVTGEAEVDGSQSDPIPHILKGIPLSLRDLRVYADRPSFTFNATNCEPSAARATLFGSFLNAIDPADDQPVGLRARYQAANCAALGFKPKLAIALKGGTKRGGHPALKAVVTPRAGDANFAGAVVTLPHSAFLDQGHIRTICTRVQFAADGGNGAGCPAASVYGHAKVWTPVLEDPLTGSVFLRSSNHNLPDLVLALHGLVNIDLASRIDSVHGGIRSTFADVPDAPVSRFVLEMQGGSKGLIVNSQNLCAVRHRASVHLTGQNGREYDLRSVVRPNCGSEGRKP